MTLEEDKICPVCGMDIEVYREVLPDGGKTCEEIEAKELDNEQGT